MEESNFICFDPLVDKITVVPDKAGNYIVVLKPGVKLPDLGFAIEYHQFKGFDVIYTGIAGQSLRERDIKGHLGRNAGRSTLRKSLGCLFGYILVPRDTEPNGKTKFNDEDEQKLSSWMIQNLMFFYYPNETFESIEDELIGKLNPPLNLSKNHNSINQAFRMKLGALRQSTSSDIRTKSRNNSPDCTGLVGGQQLYVTIWNQYLRDISIFIRKGKGEMRLNEDLFRTYGNRKNYSFRLYIENGQVPIKKGSAVARDLKRVLDSDKDFKDAAKGKNILIRLDSNFCLFVEVV